MEARRLYRNRQEATPTDLNSDNQLTQESDDHIAADGIEPGRRFVGFAVTAATALSVNIGAGRLWFDGKRYARDDVGGVVLDLGGLKPNLHHKIIALVSWGEEVETDTEARLFLTDSETMTYEPQPVPMVARRQARFEAVPGQEGISPTAPNIDASAVIIALVEMNPGGIVSITRQVSNELRNLSAVADRVEDLTEANDEIQPQVRTLKSDLARISSELQSGGDKELLLATASDIALIKSLMNLPATYVGYRGLSFQNLNDSDTAYAGYAARVEEGLRFPFQASATAEIALLNPNAAGVVKTAGGMLLPAYTEIERRITKGDAGTLSLAEYSNLENRTLTRLSMSRSRIRYGADFEVSMGSAFWAGGTYTDRLNNGVRGVFQKAGENFQVLDTGKVDAEGHRIVRLARVWTDEVAAPYWSRLPTEEILLGYAHVETFLNPQDALITALGPHIKGKPAAGQLTVGICETERGQPNFDRILALSTVNAADIAVVGDAGNPPKVRIEPTFLEGGKRYGYFYVTQHAFQVGVTDAQGAATQGATGTYFYGMNGGTWFPDPSVHLIWRDWRASFAKSAIDVDFEPLQLLGGIQGIDVLVDSIIPGSTDLVWSVNIAGFWRALSDLDPQLLEGLAPLLQFRATFVGTPDIMPVIRLPGSRTVVSRMATALKHVTPQKALPATTSQITAKYRLRGFDAAHHTFTPTIIRADGTIETHDTMVPVLHSDGVLERTYTFNLAAATNGFRSIIDATTDHPLRPFTVVEGTEVAH